MSTITFEARPPAEAVAYLEDKVVGGRFSFDWRDVWREEHLNSFVVAKAATADILTDVHSALITAIKEGQTREQFIAGLKPALQAKGWWGRQAVTDPLTGVADLKQLGSTRRLKNIFNVNMRMAHAAGRWERFNRSKATRPYLTYKHTDGQHPRIFHQAWDGITLPIDHPFWKTHYCPNGWGCKCYVVSVRKPEAVTTEEELQAKGVYETRTWRNTRTGEETQVPIGIDPGFDYNVGQARLANFVPPASPERQRTVVVGERTPAALPSLPAPRRARQAIIRDDLVGKDAGTVFDAFSKVLGKGEGEVFVDAAQVPVVVGRRLFEQRDAAGVVLGDKAALPGRASYAELLGAALKDPDEIWHSMQIRADGSSVLVRNYVAAFKTDAGRELFVASFHHRDDVWWGTTAYPPGRRGRAQDQKTQTDTGFRVGVLVYQRPK